MLYFGELCVFNNSEKFHTNDMFACGYECASQYLPASLCVCCVHMKQTGL